MAAKHCSWQDYSNAGEFDNLHLQQRLPRCFPEILEHSIVRFRYVHIGNALRWQGADFQLAQTSLRLHTGSLHVLPTNAAGYLNTVGGHVSLNRFHWFRTATI